MEVFFRSSNEKLRDFSRVDSLARSAVEELLAEFTSPSFLKAEMWLLDPLKKNLENVLDQNFGWFTRNFEYIVKKMSKISSVFFVWAFGNQFLHIHQVLYLRHQNPVAIARLTIIISRYQQLFFQIQSLTGHCPEPFWTGHPATGKAHVSHWAAKRGGSTQYPAI